MDTMISLGSFVWKHTTKSITAVSIYRTGFMAIPTSSE